MKLSILIPTLKERKASFNFIYDKLKRLSEGLPVEILTYSDNREKLVGYKRNDLLGKAKGEYVCFVDDDDDVSDNYISKILKAAEQNPDCIGLIGIITFSGKNPKRFVHSFVHDSYFEKNGVYFRPPNHLNPIKTDIAKKFKFPEKNFGEDTDWAMQICNAGVITSEVEIEEPIYFYKFEPNK